MKDNKLIAEFMGWTPCDPNDSTMYANPTNGALHSSHSAMRFHTDWNWLMPVAKKCINPEDNTKGWDNLAVALTTCNIDEVYLAVVEFIKTYNDGSTSTS